MSQGSQDIDQACPSNAGMSRFVVQSSDVLQDMRVSVSEEGSEKVVWYKERFLGDNEIIEHLVHNYSSSICWIIHRPKRGWYIRMRSPRFPPGVYIPFTPVPQSSPYHTDAALSFKTRTNIPGTSFEEEESSSRASSSSIHSYPPTPVAVPISLPSSSSSSQATSQHRQSVIPNLCPSNQVTQFILSPHSMQPQVTPTDATFFTRALSALKNHRPSHSNSFTLSRVPGCPPPPYASSLSVAAQSSTSRTTPAAPLAPPLITFHDRTPVLTVRSITGLIELNKAEEALLGVDTSFWIAVALTYLEFLEERESYLAALGD